MRISFVVLILTGLALLGCAHDKKATVKPSPAQTHDTAASPALAPGAPIVTPSAELTGKVARYNDAGRFVVLEFPPGRMPSLEQRLFVYRNSLKVGEIKVTGPQRDDHIVADLTGGEAQTGDEVREK